MGIMQGLWDRQVRNEVERAPDPSEKAVSYIAHVMSGIEEQGKNRDQRIEAIRSSALGGVTDIIRTNAAGWGDLGRQLGVEIQAALVGSDVELAQRDMGDDYSRGFRGAVRRAEVALEAAGREMDRRHAEGIATNGAGATLATIREQAIAKWGEYGQGGVREDREGPQRPNDIKVGGQGGDLSVDVLCKRAEVAMDQWAAEARADSGRVVSERQAGVLQRLLGDGTDRDTVSVGGKTGEDTVE